MSILEVKNLSHGFGDRAIFEDVSFRLLKGEHIGLVGANGEGKSTFMSIVTGKMQPDEGKVEWSKYVTAGYLDQHSVLEEGQTVRDVLRTAFDELFTAEARINDLYMAMAEEGADVDALMEEVGELQERLESRDFYTLDAKIDEVARALGVMDFGMDTDVTSLSGGRRTKVLLAKLLLEKPDILLLDEPTNYLDAEHIDWLKRYLQNYENAFVLISHDIPFLNDVINIVYHVENQQLTRYSGDYYQFLEVYEMKKSQLEAAYERQQKEIADLKDFVARNKARVATRNMAMSRQKKLDKMELIELQSEKPKPSFEFKNARTPGRFIFQAKDLQIGYDRPLTKPLNLTFERNQKVAIIGANGIGKTTLLKSLLGIIPPIAGEVERGDYLELGYFEQEVEGGNRQTPLEAVWNAFPALNQAEVRAALARCGLTTKHIESQIQVLSGGEQAKVRFCLLMNRENNVLVLDEPTNYLDAEHIDWLKRYLQNYVNAFVLISHDIPFLNDVINIVYHVENQQLTRYSGDYYQFLEVYEMKKSQLEAAYERQQKEIADLKDFVARNKARVATRNMAMSRQKKLDKMELIELQSEKPKPSFEFKNARTPGRFIFQAKDLQIGYDRPLTKPLNLTFERNQKVAIIGANGIGKTTLLKSLLGIIPPIAGEVERGDYLELGYFEQEVEGGNRQTPLEAVWNAFPALNQAEVRAALARCGLTTKHIESQIQVLSGGEQAKVRFCLLMNRENNVLVLDEPTNHLDVDAKDELKRALKEYKGSILMVCHEPDFYEGWMDQIWDFNELT